MTEVQGEGDEGRMVARAIKVVLWVDSPPPGDEQAEENYRMDLEDALYEQSFMHALRRCAERLIGENDTLKRIRGAVSVFSDD